MATTRPKTLDECATPQEALVELCLPFVADRSQVRTACSEVPAEQMPEPFHWLLVHKNHMTKVLEAQYGRPMELEVVKHHLEDEFYTRKIILRPQATDVIVEVGIVRLNFRFMSAEVRDEILKRETPLGAILIRHKVLRKVEPRWYLKFPANAPLLAAAGAVFPHTTYGRLGTIYCNGEPAIEVLEIVSGLERHFDERVD
jgi:chorismate-pyruvate lyase